MNPTIDRAICVHCKHRWHAVFWGSSKQDKNFECPKCHNDKGCSVDWFNEVGEIEAIQQLRIERVDES